jgi:hypothetical protein
MNDEDIQMQEAGFVESNGPINFQTKLFNLKEEFYKESMNAPSSLKQELLLMEILREDLYDIADAIDGYIDSKTFKVPLNNTIAVYNQNSKKITEDVQKYSKNKQELISEFMEILRDIIDSDDAIEPEHKKYYVDQAFRIYVFNLEPLPGAHDGEGI